MSTPAMDSRCWISRLPVRGVAFFALLYLYLWSLVDVGLVYYAHEVTTEFPVFLRGGAFLKDFLLYPGGLLEYASAGVSQYFYYGWAGALIVAVVAALLCLFGRLFIEAATGVRIRVLHYVPALIVLVLYSGYSHQLTACLVVLSAAMLACAYSWLPLRNGAARVAVFALLCGVLHYVAGGAYLLFGLMCVLVEALRRRKWLPAVACLAVTAAVPYVVGRRIMLVPTAAAYVRLLPFEGKATWQTGVLLLGLLSFYVLAPAALAAWRATAAARAARAEAGAQGPPGKLLWWAETGALVVAAGLCAALSYEGGLRTVLRIERYARAEEWPELLGEARRLPEGWYDLSVGWHVNRALYHTGQLPYQMFSFPQSELHLLPSDAAFADYRMPDTVFADFADVLFELAAVNTAEYMGCRALEFVGDRPFLLRRLALISIAKREPEAARILLGSLSRDLIMGGWARRCLARLQADPTLSDDAEIQQARSAMVVKDTIGFAPFEQMLLELLEANGHNQMAFEYLMAYYLLMRDLDGVVANIGRLDDFDYPLIPRHYEEALALYALAKGTAGDFGKRTVGWETWSRLGEFNLILERFGGNAAAARQAAAPEFGDSYFFYYKFGVSGVTR